MEDLPLLPLVRQIVLVLPLGFPQMLPLLPNVLNPFLRLPSFVHYVLDVLTRNLVMLAKTVLQPQTGPLVEYEAGQRLRQHCPEGLLQRPQHASMLL